MNQPLLYVRRRDTSVLLLAMAALLTGCVQIPLGAPVASMDNIQKAKASGMGPVSVGEFQGPSGPDASMDRSLSIRAASVSSPIQGSFAQYLRENLIVELRSAGLLDPASKTVITGILTDSQVDASGSSTGTGSLGARFRVTRDGSLVYEKELRVQATWESSFIGVTAITSAVNQYTVLYRKLIAQLLDDPAFRAAVRS